MRFHFLTIFPDMISSYVHESILKRAQEKKLISFEVKNIRDFSKDRHHKVDHRPYGGGPGMVMNAEPILRAHAKLKLKGKKPKVIMLSPSGKLFTNVVAKKMAKQYSDIIFICGRYEGVDDRVRKILKAEEYSVGAYVLTGGELPALTMTDAIVRQIPGVLGDHESIEENRAASPRVYTRPETVVWPQVKGKSAQGGSVFGRKYTVPKVLLGGNHKKIDEWREKQQR